MCAQRLIPDPLALVEDFHMPLVDTPTYLSTKIKGIGPSDVVPGAFSMSSEPRFGIFSGSFENDALWLETVSGFTKARERMEQLASQAPGKYFVFSVHSRGLLASIDTSRLAQAPMRARVSR